MTKRTETNHTAESLKVGDSLACNGFPGTVSEICTGQLAGMAVVRLARGSVCVSISELIRFQNAFDA